MAMPPSATFHYVTKIPLGVAQASPWQMKSVESFKPSGDSLLDCRLVGWEPLLFVNDAGMTPSPSVSRPSVWRSELRFVATDTEYAAQSTVSYFVDKALIHAMRQGDVFHIARTECGGFGASAIRQGKLIFAVGQVTAVPLGSEISVKTPYDLLDRAERIFRQRDPKFEFADYPVEVCIGGSRKIWYGGLAEIGGYHIWVEHGFIPGMPPGTPESVSITLDQVCDWVAGSASAQLLLT